LVQSVPDKYAEQALGIPRQFVTTLAFQDRYGREESNNNLNVFLQVTHTNDKVASLRGVQLGRDDIQVFINGIDQGNMVKTVEIPINWFTQITKMKLRWISFKEDKVNTSSFKQIQ
jgi:hypothetical protein